MNSDSLLKTLPVRLDHSLFINATFLLRNQMYNPCSRIVHSLFLGCLFPCLMHFLGGLDCQGIGQAYYYQVRYKCNEKQIRWLLQRESQLIYWIILFFFCDVNAYPFSEILSIIVLDLLSPMHKSHYLLLSLLLTCLHSLPIPNILWVFLQDTNDLNQLQLFSLNNIRHYSLQSNHQLRVITTLNYTEYINSTQEIVSILSHRFLDRSVMQRAIVQLSILQIYGGVWLDLPAIMTESLSWLETIKNQRHINNRIDQPKIILFYSPQWMEETYKRTDLKVQSLAVYPNLHSWFVATQMESQFIKDWKKVVVEIVGKTQSQLDNFYHAYGLDPQEYLLDSSRFLEWTAQATVKIMQKQLDKQYGISPRRLAINHYQLTSINAAETAYLLNAEAKGHTHLTTKYFTQLPILHLGLKFTYLLMPQPKVAEEMSAIVDPGLPMSQHLHSSVSLLCEDEEIPYRHIIADSVIDRFLFRIELKNTMKSYSPQYIKQRCSTTYQSVFYQLLTNYILPALAIFIHLYVVRRMMLIFRPEWGVRRKISP